MRPTISLLHPSRSRAFKSYNNICNWMRRAMDSRDVEVIVSVDEDDPELERYKNYFGGDLIVNKNRSAVDAVNNAAKKACGSIFIVVSDDTDCEPSWRLQILHDTDGKNDFVVKTPDGIQPWIITNPIMDRDYYNRFKYIYHPDYQHMFCDTEFTCVADLTGRKITSSAVFKHNHYSVTKEPPDAISKRADATWDQGEKLFLERYKRNFDLPPDQIKGKIQDNGMINWLKRKIR